MENILKVVLIMVGIVNGYPVIAAFFPQALQNLYGLSVDNSNLLILLRHRAILFGLLGGFLILSAFDKTLYFYAVIMGLVSMVAYILIGFRATNYNAKIKRVIVIDVVASVILAVTYILYFLLAFEGR